MPENVNNDFFKLDLDPCDFYGVEDDEKSQVDSRDNQRKKKNGDDPRDTPPPIIHGEEIDDPCAPIFVDGINNNDCDAKGKDVDANLTGKIYTLIYPGSKWDSNKTKAIEEINRSVAFCAKYCIYLHVKQVQYSDRAARQMRNAYQTWHAGVTQAIGGIDHWGTTTINSDFNRSFGTAMKMVQTAAVRSKKKLLVIFMDEYITVHRPTLVSANQKDIHQIGINWTDSGSPYILAHELVHALGKSKYNIPGPVTWSHNSPCDLAITKVGRRSARSTFDFSGKLLDHAEYKEIETNKGGGVLKRRRGGCDAPT